MGAKWATCGPWKAQTEVAAIALNQKVVDKFFLKVCAEGEGARQGVWPQCLVSPLLSLLIFLSSSLSIFLKFSFPHSVFFPSSSLSLSIISFLFPSFIFPSFFLLSLSLPLPFLLPSLSFVSFPLHSFSLTFSFLLLLFFSVLTSFFPFSILLHSLIPSSSVPFSFSLFSSFSIFRSFSIFFLFFLFHFFFLFIFFSLSLFFFFASVRPP